MIRGEKHRASAMVSPYRVVVIMCVGLIMILIPSVLGVHSADVTFFYSWAANLILIVRIIDYKRIFGKTINKFSLFIIAFFMYTFGKTLLFSLGIIGEKDWSGIYSTESVNSYLFFSVPAFYFFSMAGLVISKRAAKNMEARKIITKESDKRIVRITGCVFFCLLVLSAPFYIGSWTKFIITAREHGYAANFGEGGSSSSLVTNVALFFIPAVIFCFFCCKRKIFKYLLLFCLLAIGISYLFVGSRGNSVALMVSAMFIWLEELCPPKKRKVYIITIIISVFLLLGLFSVLRDIRDHSLGSPSEIISILFSGNIFDEAVSAIKEIGGTAIAWIRVREIVPEIYEYQYGYSYLAAFLACIPSAVIGYSFADDAALDVWLTKIMNANYGVGFSTMAEAYVNFGWLGILLIFFLGLFIFWCLCGSIWRNKPTRLDAAVSAVALYVFSNTARNPLALSVRNMVYGVVIPLALIKFLSIIRIKPARGDKRDYSCG